MISKKDALLRARSCIGEDREAEEISQTREGSSLFWVVVFKRPQPPLRFGYSPCGDLMVYVNASSGEAEVIYPL